MKRTTTLLAALALLAAPCWAGGALGAYGSWWDADQADDDVGGGVLVEFGLGSRIDVELRTTWYNGFTTPVGGRLEDLTATSVRPGLSYNFVPGGKANPYLGAGLDYVLFDLRDNGVGSIKDEMGWYALLGIEFPVGTRFKLFAEGLYTQVSATIEGDDLGFSRVERRFDMAGPVLNVGLSFTW